jgi:hypothetical protein
MRVRLRSGAELIPAQALLNRMQELHDMIARRAYEIFEAVGPNTAFLAVRLLLFRKLLCNV